MGICKKWAYAKMGVCENGRMRKWAYAKWAYAKMGVCKNGRMQKWAYAIRPYDKIINRVTV